MEADFLLNTWTERSQEEGQYPRTRTLLLSSTPNLTHQHGEWICTNTGGSNKVSQRTEGAPLHWLDAYTISHVTCEAPSKKSYITPHMSASYKQGLTGKQTHGANLCQFYHTDHAHNPHHSLLYTILPLKCHTHSLATI